MARLKVVVLASCMLLFGTINTLTTKFQDLAVVGHSPDGKPVTFKHPAVQSAFMFFGELLCLLPYYLMEWRYSNTKSRVRRRAELERRGPAFRTRRMLIFAVPAACDAVATTLLNLGLYYTFASTYQMLRGTLVLFAGFFTVTILRRRLYIHHWLGMALITGGAALVGAASVLSAQQAGKHSADSPSEAAAVMSGVVGGMAGAAAGGGGRLLQGARLLASALLGSDPGVDAASAPLFGDLCVVAAQAFTALQFILEEKFVSAYRVPTLLAVGLEGLWGMAVCAVALPLLGATRAGPDGLPIDSAVQALREVASHGPLAASVALSIVSIGFFNFFGISVTKALSGAGRATIDATRTLFIWLASMWLGWERFLPLQVVGFAVLFAGTSLYNELIRICLPRPEELEEAEVEVLYGSGGSGAAGAGAGSGSGSGSDSESGYESESSSGGQGAADEEAGALAEPLLPAAVSRLQKTQAASASATSLGPSSSSTSISSAAPPNGARAVPAPAGQAAVAAAGGGRYAVAATAATGGAGARAHGLSQYQQQLQTSAMAAAAAAGMQAGVGMQGAAGAGRPVGRRLSGRESSDGLDEYTMARSMRLGHSTLLPHALDADTDDGATESEGPAGYSPGGMSFGSGHTGGLLSQPNIPEGDEGDMVGPMSGVDVNGSGTPGGRGPMGLRGHARSGSREERVSIAIGPHGMLSGGVGRGGASGGGARGGSGRRQ